MSYSDDLFDDFDDYLGEYDYNDFESLSDEEMLAGFDIEEEE